MLLLSHIKSFCVLDCLLSAYSLIAKQSDSLKALFYYFTNIGMSKKLFVGNISWGVSDDQLKEAFEAFGDVEDSIILKDRATGRSRGFGFVTFSDDGAADEAVAAMHEKEMDGRALVVNEAKPPKPRDEY